MLSTTVQKNGVLANIGYSTIDGKLTYNGNNVDTTVAQRDVYHGVDNPSTTVSLSAGTGKLINDKVISNTNALTLLVAHRTNLNNPHNTTADQITIATGTFTGNLNSTTNNVQKLATMVDTLVINSTTPTPQLRGVPVATTLELKALVAKEYEIRKVLANNREYVFTLTANLSTIEGNDINNLPDDAATGKWVLQELAITIPNVINDGDMLKYDQATNKLVRHTPLPTWRVLSTHSVGATITTDALVNTGHDLQANIEGKIIFSFRDSDGVDDRPWNEAPIDLVTFRAQNSAYVWNYDTAYITIDILDAVTGTIRITASHRAAKYVSSRIEILY